MKRRKIWSILALAALTGSLLAGCGEVKTEEQTKETKQEEKPAELLVLLQRVWNILMKKNCFLCLKRKIRILP
ncbi:MAG: hypothetical protein ACLRMN_06960 [Mediterraneibacter gnavus]